MNIITNLNFCYEAMTETINVSLLYYSHLPSIIVSLLLGYFVIKNRKNLSNKLLFALSLVFSIWCILDLITWVSIDSRLILYTWSIMGIFDGLIFILSFYLIYVFIYEKDLSLVKKMLLGLLLLPVIIMTPTNYNLGGFLLSDCKVPLF